MSKDTEKRLTKNEHMHLKLNYKSIMKVILELNNTTYIRNIKLEMKEIS